MTEDLRERIEQLEREKHWWKRLATTLGILLLLAGGVGVYQVQQARRARELAVQAAAAEADAHRAAVGRALEAARRAAEKKP